VPTKWLGFRRAFRVRGRGNQVIAAAPRTPTVTRSLLKEIAAGNEKALFVLVKLIGVRALGNIGAPFVIEILCDLIVDGSAVVSWSAARALQRFGPAGAAPLFTRVAIAKSEETLTKLVDALKAIPDPQVGRRLDAMVEDIHRSCPYCVGTGKIGVHGGMLTGGGRWTRYIPCGACQGRGRWREVRRRQDIVTRNGYDRNAQQRAVAGPRPPWAGTQRNARCPCGSGQKFKHCHGRM
jgi:hypothetical protein